MSARPSQLRNVALASYGKESMAMAVLLLQGDTLRLRLGGQSGLQTLLQ